MATTIPDLWPPEVKVDVLSPLVILKTQASYLSSKTGGVLLAQINTTHSNQLIQHHFDLIAPALGGYGVRLLAATHAIDNPYPVTVTSEAFDPLPPLNQPSLSGPMQAVAELATAQATAMSAFTGRTRPWPPEKRAVSDDEFIALVREVLTSDRVRARISSLLARINANKAESSNGPSQPPANPEA